MNHFLIRLWRVMKSGFYTTSGDYQLNGRIEKTLPKAKLAPKASHGHWLVVCRRSDSLQVFGFLDSSKTITSEKYEQQINEIYWELQHLQPALFNRKGPVLPHDSALTHIANKHFKNWMNWATKFCLIFHFHLISYQPTTTSSSISWQLFAG